MPSAATLGKSRLVYTSGLALLTLNSLIDEVTQIMLVVPQSDSASLHGVALILLFAMIGGIAVGPVASRLIALLGAKNSLALALGIQAVAVAMAPSSGTSPLSILVAAILGASGAFFWSSLLTTLPEIFEEEKLERVNSFAQTARNVGYIAGPALGGIVASIPSGFTLLYGLAAVSALSSLLLLLRYGTTRTKGDRVERTPTRNGSFLYGARYLFHDRTLRIALVPFLIAVASTVVLNVCLIFVVTGDMGLTYASYGALVAVLSIGLVLGPLMVPYLVRKYAAPMVALASALVIGAMLIAIGIMDSAWAIVPVLVLGGLANGVLNAAMSGLVLRRLGSRGAAGVMPAYVSLIQACVLAGYLSVTFLPASASRTSLILGGAIACLTTLLGIGIYRTSRSSKLGEKDALG